MSFVMVGLRLLWTNETKKERKGYRWGFRPVGKRVFIDDSGSVVSPVIGELDSMRIRDIENKTILSFGVFRAAHCCSCPNDQGSCSGGYFRALAPEVCTCGEAAEEDCG